MVDGRASVAIPGYNFPHSIPAPPEAKPKTEIELTVEIRRIDEATVTVGLSDLGTPIPGKRIGGEPASEADYFYPCPVCGQKIDQRDFRLVFYHEEWQHEPPEPEPGATILQFPRRK